MIEQVSVVDNLNTAIEGKMEIAVIGTTSVIQYCTCSCFIGKFNDKKNHRYSLFIIIQSTCQACSLGF